MRGRWIVAAGIVLLASCRSDGRRGPASTRATTDSPQGLAAWRDRASPARPAIVPLAERVATPRLWVVLQTRIEAALAAGRLAETRAPSPAVQGYAARLVEEDTADLRALTGLARARAIDVETPGVQRDPVVAAARQASAEALARLGPLGGEAFQAAYLAAQPASLELLAALGEQGERAVSDVDVGNVLRTIAYHARERAWSVTALTPPPRACAPP